MVLEQDKPQASQAQAVLDEQQYQKDLAQYHEDLKKWESEKIRIEQENKKIIAEETKRRSDEKIANQKAEEKRLADNKTGNEQYQKDLAQYEKDLAIREVENQAIVVVKAEQTRVAKAKIESQKIAAEKLKHQQEADVRQKAFDEFKGGKLQTGQIHYGRYPNIPYAHGEISPAPPSRGTKGGKIYWIIEDSYYQRAGSILGISAEQARSVARHGMVTGSGKLRDKALRSVQDSIDGGNRAEQYAQHRALAKKTTASAYGNMSASEAATSSALATNPQAQQQAKNTQLYKLNSITGGLIGKEAPTDIYGSESLMGTNVKAPQGTTEQQIQNAKQTQRTIDLREGNVGIATALLEPVTSNTKTGITTVNAKQFLIERGYDLNNLDAVPNEIFKPVKYVEARKQATISEKTNTPMGDLTKLIPPQPTMYEQKKVGETTVGVTKNEYFKKVPNAELKKRIEARERLESIGQPQITNPQESKGESFIGYGSDGTPVQGPPSPELFKQQYQVTTADGKVRTFNSLESAEKFSQRMTTTQYEVNVPTSIPTMYGAVTVQEAVTFDSKEEAQSFIDKRQASLPYTQDAKILPLEQMYSGYDQFAKEAYKRAEDHPDSWIYQGGAAWTSFGGDMLNLATMGGDLLDKHVFDRPTIEKKPITTIPTYYDKGTEKALEGIEITETGITGVPSFNPLDKNNIASKWYQGAAAQWEKQTPAQNIGQSALFVPVAIIDTVTAGQAGTSFVRRVAPGVKTLATKIASTPTIVTKVIEASSISVKTIPVKPSYANYNINSLSNPDRIDLNLKGVDYMDSPKPPGINLQSKAFQEDLANKGIKPVDLVKLDPEYTPEKIDLNLKGDDFMVSPKPPTLNLKSKAFQEDLAKQAPRGVGNYGAERFRQFQENVSPSVNVVGRIKFSEGFVPGKPTRAYTPYRPKPVEADPYYSPEKIDLNLKGDDFMVSPKPPTLNLKSKAFLKEIKKDTPNYERAASDFADFQKSLEPKLPKRYSNIVGTIKFSDGFIPNKNPTKVTKKPDTDVKEEPFFKQDKINKKKIFDDDDKLAGWETKPVDGGQGTGTTTVQLVKSETKKPLKTSQKLLQDKKNPTPIPRDFTKLESERTLPKTGSSPLKLLPIPRDVRKKKKKPIETVTTTATITTAETSQAQSLKPTTQPISGVITKQTTRQPISGVITKQTTIQPIKSKQTTRAATKISQTPIAVMQQPQKITPVIKQSLRSSPRPRPRVRSRPKFRFRARVRSIQSQPSPIPGRARTVAGFAPPSEKKKEEEKKSKKKKRKEFLGNTRLDKIEGLFRRSEIISGDKRVAKQEKLDKAFKENKKKTRRKKTKQSFSQKMGIVSKGFKI